MQLPSEMKAVVFTQVGEHRYQSVRTPRIRASYELLVEIEASSICGSDLHILSDPPGCIATPGTIIGHEMVGRVLEVGDGVTGFQPGDRIVCDPNISCGHCAPCRTGHANMCKHLHIHGVDLPGFFTEYVCIPEKAAMKISPDLPTELAIFAEPLTCVMSAVDKARLLPGETVAVIGAGPIRLYFTALFKKNGAGRVIVIEPSQYRAAYAKEMGADVLLHPKEQDAAAQIRELTQGYGADVVVDAVGICLPDALRYVARCGRVVLFGQNGAAVQSVCQNDITRNEISVLGSYIGPYTLHATVKMLESRSIDFTRMITHRLPLEKFEEGLAAMRSGQALEVVLYAKEMKNVT